MPLRDPLAQRLDIDDDGRTNICEEGGELTTMSNIPNVEATNIPACSWTRLILEYRVRR